MERSIETGPQETGDLNIAQTEADIYDIQTGSKIEPPTDKAPEASVQSENKAATETEMKDYSIEELGVIIENNINEALKLAETPENQIVDAKMALTEPAFISDVKRGLESSTDHENANTQLAAVVYALKKAGFSKPAKPIETA